MKKILLILSVTALFAACNTTSKTTSADIVSNEWKLVEMNGKAIADAEITLQFDTIKSVAHGMGCCNNYFGSYNIDGNQLEVSDIGSTKMSCGKLDLVENEYFQALSRKSEAKLKDNRLTLKQDGKAALVFEKAEK